MDTINPPSVAHSPLPICYPRYRSLNKATKARIVSAPFSFSRTGKIFKPRGNFETTHFLRSRRKPRQQADGRTVRVGIHVSGRQLRLRCRKTIRRQPSLRSSPSARKTSASHSSQILLRPRKEPPYRLRNYGFSPALHGKRKNSLFH